MSLSSIHSQQSESTPIVAPEIKFQGASATRKVRYYALKIFDVIRSFFNLFGGNFEVSHDIHELDKIMQKPQRAINRLKKGRILNSSANSSLKCNIRSFLTETRKNLFWC